MKYANEDDVRDKKKKKPVSTNIKIFALLMS